MRWSSELDGYVGSTDGEGDSAGSGDIEAGSEEQQIGLVRPGGLTVRASGR
jgi:hypothetical protein